MREEKDKMDGEQSSGETSGEVPAVDAVQVTIGATVPTGFEGTAADEVSEKIGVEALVSKDRGRITFVVPSSELREVHQLRSVDNLFVVVEEFQGYQFKENKEEALADFTALPSKLSWDIPLGLWRQNNNIKRKKTRGQQRGQPQGQQRGSVAKGNAAPGATGSVEDGVHHLKVHDDSDATGLDEQDAAAASATTAKEEEDVVEAGDTESPASGEDVAATEEPEELPGGDGGRTLRFRVTCNRAGDGHSFTSMEAAREFGGAVQDHFGWKADMKNFDVEVLVNIHDQEMCVGIALTEESLHRRNITHFGPTTLRSTLAYGMLRLCSPQPGDIIIDPMCGTGAIPVEGKKPSRRHRAVGRVPPAAQNGLHGRLCHRHAVRKEDGIAPEELGPVPGVLTGAGSRVQAWHGARRPPHARQEVHVQGADADGSPVAEGEHGVGECGRPARRSLPAETHGRPVRRPQPRAPRACRPVRRARRHRRQRQSRRS
ncbi:tRNA (guanine(6)-N(2))-methyltransferase THUMP3 isoform X3 [Lampetra planeri]